MEVSTEKLIELLKNEDTEALDKIFITHDWDKNINWDILYNGIKDYGNPSVLNIMGYIHEYHYMVDIEKALHYYQLSADHDNSWAQINVGKCCHCGKGVKRNKEKGIYYFQLSADQGNAWGQNSLGNCYFNGNGIDRNHLKAVYYYQLSADQGYYGAQHNLGNCYYHGHGIEKDKEKAKYYYQLSADQNDPIGQYCLGNCYYYGKEVEQDYGKALHYFQLSADQGNKNAQSHVNIILESKTSMKIIKQDVEIAELKQRVAELEAENLELKYQPNGTGYEEAKNEFNQLKKID